jgi:hypothetical protein
VDVEVVDALTSLLAFVDDSTVTVNHTLFLGNSSSTNKHVSEESGVAVFSLANASKSISVLRNHQEVVAGDWEGIFERHDFIVLEENLSGDLSFHNLIENSDLLFSGSLGLFLFH